MAVFGRLFSIEARGRVEGCVDGLQVRNCATRIDMHMAHPAFVCGASLTWPEMFIVVELRVFSPSFVFCPLLALHLPVVYIIHPRKKNQEVHCKNKNQEGKRKRKKEKGKRKNTVVLYVYVLSGIRRDRRREPGKRAEIRRKRS